MFPFTPTKRSIYSLAVIFENLKTGSVLGLFALLYVLTSFRFLSSYLILDSTFWAILLITPYCMVIDQQQKGNRRYLLCSLVFLVLSIITGLFTFYLFAVGFAAFYAIESLVGTINNTPVFILGLLSPTFRYFDNMFGFPVRLQLSEWAGNALYAVGYKTSVMGNVIVMNGNEFSVDPACVGLKMMAVSLLIGLVLVAYFQRKTNKKASFFNVVSLLTCIILLNIAGNFLRIILLVVFKILPENPMHDVTGVLCLLVYVVVPAYFITKWLFTFKKQQKKQNHTKKMPFKIAFAINALLFMGVILTGFTKMDHQQTSDKILSANKIPGFTATLVKGDVLKLEKTGSLIYIKPLSRFYGAEHNPMICWVGSGYVFSRINKQICNGREVFTGTLIKGADTLYAAWWFDNGTIQTIRQLDWRWHTLQGENFYLVNVNAATREQLNSEISSFFSNKDIFKPDKGEIKKGF